VVTCLVELSGQAQSYREAAIREEDVQWFDASVSDRNVLGEIRTS
jgi:hypothetical protein